MLDIKVFTPKNIKTKKISAKKLKKIALQCIPSTHEYIKDLDKQIEAEKEMHEKYVICRDIDKIFEFKSSSNIEDIETNREENVFKDILNSLKDNPTIRYRIGDSINALSFIRMIRRNKELEEQVNIFREKTAVKNLTNLLKELHPNQEYWHLSTDNKNSELYTNPVFIKYTKAFVPMSKEIEKIFTKIFNTHTVVTDLKRIFTDLFFCGVIPIEDIITKPIEFTYDGDSLTTNISGETLETRIGRVMNSTVLNLLNNFKEDKKEYPYLSKFHADIFDFELKYFRNFPKGKNLLTHIQIASKIKKLYPKKKLKWESTSKLYKPISKKINSIFKLKK